MRPIVSNISTPTEKLSTWLLKELNGIAQPTGMYVKKSLEFVNKIKDTVLNEEDILVSFDVTALYPNVPLDIGIQCLVDHIKLQNVADKNIEIYQNVAETCMEQSFFQFKGKFYTQTFDICMGSKLAPYLSNIFMCHFEKTVSTFPLFPRVWIRYVDDVFAILKKTDIEGTLDIFVLRDS